ncbi:hypothetical protein [Cryobacterium zhongshanensis]|uniref:Uncharacterized protein n=1 Tax=Cryobacterium zhongshanensis TaxID=2928153 RepID=A0AA41QUP5_9MICO|nr:hypothetical protein [Cryobacterium zhongshanensis]MCI4657328.1 hypothetical protein [Cryobacterium zhongshanensis]
MRTWINVSLLVFLASAITWMVVRGASAEANVLSTLGATLFGALLVGLCLLRQYREAEPGERSDSYLLAGGIVVALAVGLNTWAIVGMQAERAAADPTEGTVSTVFAGSRSGDSVHMGKWQANPQVEISTDHYPETVVTMTLVAGSSSPDFDVILVLNDGIEILCESDKRANWKRSVAGVTIKAPCESVVRLRDLKQLRTVRLKESLRTGW